MALTRWLAAGAAAVGGFVLGPFIWAALSGLLAGLLDVGGIVIPAAVFLALSPVAAVVGAGIGVWAVLK